MFFLKTALCRFRTGAYLSFAEKSDSDNGYGRRNRCGRGNG